MDDQYREDLVFIPKGWLKIARRFNDVETLGYFHVSLRDEDQVLAVLIVIEPTKPKSRNHPH